jgi:hypothetical protein
VGYSRTISWDLRTEAGQDLGHELDGVHVLEGRLSCVQLPHDNSKWIDRRRLSNLPTTKNFYKIYK